MVRKPAPLPKDMEFIPMTLGMCHEKRTDCGTSWERYFKLIGVVALCFLSIVGALAVYFNTVDHENATAIAGVSERVSRQEVMLQNVEKNTEEIKDILKNRR